MPDAQYSNLSWRNFIRNPERKSFKSTKVTLVVILEFIWWMLFGVFLNVANGIEYFPFHALSLE
jgi:hypothetical protein